MKTKESKIYLYIVCFIISIGGLLLGISANVSGASQYFGDFFGIKAGSFTEGLAVSITMLATFIGNFFAGNISNRMGRKKSLVLAAVLFSFCTLGSALSQDYSFFLVSRFIGGLGIGISLLVAPMYIAELAPSEKRGFLVSFNQLNIGIGYLVAYASNTFVNDLIPDPELKWRWMLGIGFIFPLVYLIGLFFVPESPAWLFRQGRKDEARKVIDKIGSDAIAEESSSNTEKVSYKEQWQKLFSRRMRLILFVAFSVAFFQMACGINAVLFYAPKVFRMAGFTGDNSFLQSNLVGIGMVVMTLVSMALIDRLGRKPLLLIGSSIMIISLTIISVTFYNSTYKIDSTKASIVIENIKKTSSEDVHSVEIALTKLSTMESIDEKTFFSSFKEYLGDDALYTKYKDIVSDQAVSINSLLILLGILGTVAGFSISLGPITWALLSEIFPYEVKGLGISLAGMFNGIMSFIVTTLFPIEVEHLGSGNTFMIYGIVMLICLISVLLFYPETKGRKLEEIEKELIRN